MSKYLAILLAVLLLPGCVQPRGGASGKNPFGDTKFRVLIVEESEQRTSLPSDQVSLMTSTKWKSWVTEKGGVKPMMLDINDDVGVVAKPYSQVLKSHKTARKETPWLYAGCGRRGVSVRFPETEKELQDILVKVGGK
jgi:hypothetical protein